MNTYLIKLRQNIFQVTLATAAILGLALAYFTGSAVNFWLEQPLPVVVTSGAVHDQAALVSPPDRSQIKSIATDNLLRGSVVSVEEEETQFSIEGITLIGVLAGSRRYARASILLEEEKSVRAYAIGETIRSAKLAAIYIDSAVLEDPGGSRFKLELGSDTKPPEPKPGAVSTAQQTGKKASRVEKITLNRDRFKQLIKNQADLFRLKFAPALKKGKISGWRLLKVPTDHFLYSMGARTGDIIRRYNGQELESQDRMINMWQSLQTANNVSVDVERRGQNITYDISIQ